MVLTIRQWSAIGMAAMLVACAGATTQSPNVSAEELVREQRLQKEIIKNEANKAKVTTAIPTQAMLDRLRRLAEPIHKAGLEVCLDLGRKNCSLPFRLETEKDKTDAINAYTDGKQIVVTPAMMNFATSDAQLATVLAHEYAHAIMTHPQQTGQNATVGSLLGLAVDTLANSQGVSTQGVFSKLGGQAAILRYSQGFEKEADYIGLYIMQRAGYDIDKAPYLWRRMAALNPNGIYVGSTHPTTAERYILLEKTATEIKQKQRSKKPLLPDFRPAD